MSHEASGIRAPGTTPRSATLEGFAAACGEGVALATLEPFTTLLVDTRNTRYRIVISRGCDVLIEGGPFFPERMSAHLAGASVGGSLLKVGWIGLGLAMEIYAGGRRIVTTPVRSIVPMKPHAAPQSIGPH